MGRRKRFNRGRWELERERHRIEPSLPASGFVESTAIEDVLPRLVKRLGIADRHWEVALTEEWEALVGGAVAKHSRPGGLADGALIVYVDSAVWLDQLKRYHRQHVLAKVQERFGQSKVRDIRFAPDPG